MSYKNPTDGKRWRTSRALGYDTSPVPSGPIREHVLALTEHQFLSYSIATAAGVTQTAVDRIRRGLNPTTRQRVANAILAVTPQSIFASAGDCHKVPAYASQRRLRALAALGWRLDDIDAHMETGQRAKAINGNTWVYGKVHRRIAAVYEELSGKVGPSERTRRQARARGYAPPLAWDDIEDPNERPDEEGVDAEPLEWSPKFGPCSHDGVDDVAIERTLAGDHVHLTPLERHRVVVVGTERDLSSHEIADLLHTTQRTVVRHRALHASTCTVAETERTAA
ncbi:MAG: hypothetical protein AB7G37_21705 [Solirubrobacteraceae bacterium]